MDQFDKFNMSLKEILGMENEYELMHKSSKVRLQPRQGACQAIFEIRPVP